MPLFESMAARPEVVGIGEIGLDYYYEFSPPDTQMRTLSFFLEMAARLNKPACLHVRDKSGESRAVDDLLGALRPLAGRLRGVVHCFSGGLEDARRILDLGLHLSFTGILTFKNASALRDVFARLPADRILLETDAPYLAPDPHRGHRNEPMFLTRIFTLSAGLLRLAEPDWSDRLRLNQTQVFGRACA